MQVVDVLLELNGLTEAEQERRMIQRSFPISRSNNRFVVPTSRKTRKSILSGNLGLHETIEVEWQYPRTLTDSRISNLLTRPHSPRLGRLSKQSIKCPRPMWTSTVTAAVLLSTKQAMQDG